MIAAAVGAVVQPDILSTRVQERERGLDVKRFKEVEYSLEEDV